MKLAWSATPRVEAQLVVVNGWQNVSENNDGKGVGARVDFRLTGATLSYYNLFSAEDGSRLRMLNGLGVRGTAGRVAIVGQFDIGSQEKSAVDGGTALWTGASANA